MPLSLATTPWVVRDATADYSDIEMRAALDVDLPNYAGAVVTTGEVVDAISVLDVVPGVGPKSVSHVALPFH